MGYMIWLILIKKKWWYIFSQKNFQNLVQERLFWYTQCHACKQKGSLFYVFWHWWHYKKQWITYCRLIMLILWKLYSNKMINSLVEMIFPSYSRTFSKEMMFCMWFRNNHSKKYQCIKKLSAQGSRSPAETFMSTHSLNENKQNIFNAIGV